MPNKERLDISEELSRLSLSDTLYLLRELGEKKQAADLSVATSVDPQGIKDTSGPDERIDFATEIDKIGKQLSFNTAFDDFDFSGLVKKGQIEPAVALEEMQLLADYATTPPPPVVLTPEQQADDFLAFSSFDDIIL